MMMIATLVAQGATKTISSHTDGDDYKFSGTRATKTVVSSHTDDDDCKFSATGATMTIVPFALMMTIASLVSQGQLRP